MLTMPRKKGLLNIVLILVLIVTGFTSQAATAGLISTEEALAEQAAVEQSEQAEKKRDHVMAMLDREEVRAQLVHYGVSADEAAERVASLSDSEVMELSENMHSLPAGAGISTVTLLLILILIVLLVR